MVLYGIVFIGKEFEADKLVVTDRFVAVTWLELAGYRHTSNNGNCYKIRISESAF